MTIYLYIHTVYYVYIYIYVHMYNRFVQNKRRRPQFVGKTMSFPMLPRRLGHGAGMQQILHQRLNQAASRLVNLPAKR